jgi:hypothetical protein
MLEILKLVYHKLDSKDLKSLDDLMVFDRVHLALSGEFFREQCELDFPPCVTVLHENCSKRHCSK